MIYVRDITQNMLDKAIAFPKGADKYFGLDEDKGSKEIEIYEVKDLLGEIKALSDTLRFEFSRRNEQQRSSADFRITSHIKSHFKGGRALTAGDYLLFGYDEEGKFCFERLNSTSMLIPSLLKSLDGSRFGELDALNSAVIANLHFGQADNYRFFVEWLIEKCEPGKEYFKYFSNYQRHKFYLVIDNWRNIYKQEFNQDIFNFNRISFKEHYYVHRKNVYKKHGQFSDFSKLTRNNAPRAIFGDKNFKFFFSHVVSACTNNNVFSEQINFSSFGMDHVFSILRNSGLHFSNVVISRFVCSLQAKPFVILSGLSGSGKTKLAESFAMYISESDEQWMLVPVGADWTNRDSLLGYENTITKAYSLPAYNVPEFINRASLEENRHKPYFLILDEMNLSVVERYFADFLSAMESSNKEISLHQMKEQENEKQKLPPKKLKLPLNLFIIGTVNIDESTYMFSPKVLDRANTIEFRLNETDVAAFLHRGAVTLNLDELVGKGKDMAASFVQNCRIELDKDLIEKIDDLLIDTFKPLKKAGAEFGYRTITEIRQLATQLNQFDIESKKERSEADKFEKEEAIFDIAILQKLLPKLHGSVGKLKLPLTTLAELCFDEGKWDDKFLNTENEEWKLSADIRYPLSFEKIKSMYVRLSQNGFVSFAEA